MDENVFYGKEKQLEFYSEYELGKITTESLIKKFNEYHHSKLNHDEFSYCWNAMIFDFPKNRIELIDKLRRGGKKILLLSNINELHEEAVQKSFASLKLNLDFHSIFDKVYYSHRLGMRKPTAEIFKYIINENKLSESETLFIDDSLHHVLGAKSINIDSIHLQKPLTLTELSIFKEAIP